MATFEKRGPYQVRAKIRKKGHETVTKTFNTMADAKAWARKTESEIERGLYICPIEAEQTTLGEALERYAREVAKNKKGAGQDLNRIKAWLRHPWAKRSLMSIRGADIAKHRDERLEAGITPSTVRRDLAVLSHLFTVAKKEWGMESLSNPVQAIRLPSPNRARDRRLVKDEADRLLATAKASMSREIAPIIMIALETAARRSEIINMTWTHVDLAKKTWHIPETKNGTPRTVPLSSQAVSLLAGVPQRIDGRVWSYRHPDGVTRAFDRICKRAGIDALRFHDLRHEATSRLFEKGLSMMEVATITGHKDLRMLLRYTHLRAEDLAVKLG